ncbi:MAG: hypothetical protein ACK5CE_17395 [Actinomycetes bacterium]
MIEFLPPRDGAFGDRDAADFVGLDGFDDDDFDDEPDEEPRSPWLTALAALAVAGLLAGGVIDAAPWDGDDASPPTTAVTETSSPTATTAPAAPDALETDDPLLPSSLERPPGWLPTGDGAGFVVAGATSSTGSGSAGDAFAFWSTEGATRTSGRWLAIDEIPTDYAELRRDATVIDVSRTDGTWPALLTSSDDGVVELAVARTDPLLPWFALTGYGWSLGELLTLAADVEVEPGSISYPDDLVADGGPLSELVETYNGTTDWDPGATVTGRGRAFTWLGSNRTGAQAAVVVSAVATPSLFIAQFMVRVPVEDTALRRAELDAINDLARAGRQVSLFRAARDPSAIGAVWYDGGGNEVMVVSNGRTGELLDLVASLEQASPDEWAAAMADEGTPTGIDDRPVPVGGSINEGWSVQVSSSSMWISASDGWLSTRYPPTEGRAATRYANTEAAYLVVVDATRGGADGRIASVVVVRQGDIVQEVALVGLVGGTSAAAVRVDPRAPFEVTWLGADGVELGGS